MLSGFSFISFHLAEASLSAFSRFLCVQLPKTVTKFILFITIHILVLILQATCKQSKRKQTMEQQLHRACERTKSKQKQNQVPLYPKLITRSIARFSPQIIQWSH